MTHNGEISIAAGTADTVEGVATVTAWAETDERAKEELADLKVLQEQSGESCGCRCRCRTVAAAT